MTWPIKEDEGFPVLLARAGRGALCDIEQGGLLELRLRLRQAGDTAPLSDALVDLFPDPDAIESAFAALIYARRSLGLCVDDWVVDVGSTTRQSPAMANGISGDSFTLALLFQLVAYCHGTGWPEGVFVTGAVRRARGFRCVAVGQAIAKCRWLERHGYRRLLLPRRNYAQIERAGINCDRCVALPTNLGECIEVWKQCLTSTHRLTLPETSPA